MPGVPQRSGGTPKRSEERRRTNSPQAEQVTPLAAPVEAPPAPDGLDELTLRWYESLKISGQARYYEPSDWEYAGFLAQLMAKVRKQQEPSASLVAAIQTGLRQILATEGDRRMGRLEVQRQAPEKAPGSIALDEYRAALTKGGRRGAGN